MSSSPRWVVCKFGGTSVSSQHRWATIAQVARDRLDQGLRPVIVCSALAGVSNQLVSLLAAAPSGQHRPLLDQLEATHVDLAAALGFPLPDDVADFLDFLRRVADGIHLVGEVSPRTHARVLATGELMSTLLGTHWLQAQGLGARWVDARALLVSTDGEDLPLERRYLSANCGHGADPALQAELAGLDAQVVVTQGFIAREPSRGETVLLGRGGSDTSAALLAARLDAARCEIWTDVPGMFTANPHRHPEARLLRSLDYDEAQEIASMGAKVLHPRCIAPLRHGEIPLEIRCTPDPALPPTVIRHLPGRAPGVKAVSSRSGLVLVSMETLGMWQQVGFLADAFARFKQLGLSIDLVATSESNVTVSLDPAANVLDDDVLRRLERALAPLCEPRVIRGCASVSLVGRGIRSILHRLSRVFELFEEQRIHLLSQAASDLNLTVVVDEDQADRLVGQLHGMLLAEVEGSADFGPSWTELSEAPASAAPAARWWSGKRDALLALAERHTPHYVYDGPTVDARAQSLLALRSVSRVLFAMKANSNRQLLARLRDQGVGFECVSPGEVALARATLDQTGSTAPLLFTPNFAGPDEYTRGFELGAHVTLDNLHPLRSWPERFAGRQVLLRLDPGQGAGHHAHVRTAGARSKFGISLEQLPEARALADRHGVRIVGLHAHVGSGVRDPEAWRRTAETFQGLLDQLPDVRILDLGGGLGVPEKAGQAPLDLDRLDQQLAALDLGARGVELWLEPGRFLVAEAGVLLARVQQRKDKGPVRYVGVDAGMHSLIRPALYGAWHDIVNLTRVVEADPPLVVVDVVGPICETGDVLGRGRRLREPREGDVLLVDTAGAYGRVMASEYNLRGLPAETVLD